jgi:hypothetical protein
MEDGPAKQAALLNASLVEFDYQAQRQRDQFSDQIVAIYGDTIKTTQGYADEMALLERTLGEERLSVIKQYNDQIKQQEEQAKATAGGVVSQITDYLKKFQIGGDSPLGPMAQYNLASSQFNAVSGAAGAGDFNSIQKFTTYADTLATSARVVFGSGKGYADAVERILQAAGKIGEIAPDQLTASVLRSETRSQTQQLSDKLDELIAEVQSLKAEPVSAVQRACKGVLDQ